MERTAILGERIFGAIKEANLDDENIGKIFTSKNLKILIGWMDGIRKIEVGPVEFPEPLENNGPIIKDSWYSGLKVFDETKVYFMNFEEFPEHFRIHSIKKCAEWMPNDGSCLPYGWYHAHFLCFHPYLINSWDKEFNYLAVGTYFNDSEFLIRMTYDGELWIPKEISFNDPMGPKDRIVVQGISM